MTSGGQSQVPGICPRRGAVAAPVADPLQRVTQQGGRRIFAVALGAHPEHEVAVEHGPAQSTAPQPFAANQQDRRSPRSSGPCPRQPEPQRLSPSR